MGGAQRGYTVLPAASAAPGDASSSCGQEGPKPHQASQPDAASANGASCKSGGGGDTHTGSWARTPESPSAGGTASWAPGSSPRGAGVTHAVGQGPASTTDTEQMEAELAPPGQRPLSSHPTRSALSRALTAAVCNDGKGQAAVTALSAGQGLRATTLPSSAASLQSSPSRAASGPGTQCPVPAGPESDQGRRDRQLLE